MTDHFTPCCARMWGGNNNSNNNPVNLLHFGVDKFSVTLHKTPYFGICEPSYIFGYDSSTHLMPILSGRRGIDTPTSGLALSLLIFTVVLRGRKRTR